MMKKSKTGFTLVELILAMAFISVLLITIALLVINVTGIYTKGTTIKNVNVVGRSIVEDMRRTIASSPAVDVDNATSYFVKNGNSGGRFCTGSYSYVWNNATALIAGGGSIVNQYSDNSKTAYLVKIKDGSREYCSNPAKKIDVNQEPLELLGGSETDLAIHNFQAYKPITSDTSGQIFYSVSFVLGTLRGSEQIHTNATCKVPSDINTDFNYCAINKFSFSMRAIGNSQ